MGTPVAVVMPAYGDDGYWDERYTGSETEHFEWYASFLEIEEKITSACKDKEARVLVIGCGNSRFSEQMADAGSRRRSSAGADAGWVQVTSTSLVSIFRTSS